MTTAELLNAHNTYATDYAAWETAHPFDLLTMMDRPNPPYQSFEAEAGEMIARRGGLAGALAEALTSALNYECSDRQRAVYMELTIAAVDGE